MIPENRTTHLGKGRGAFIMVWSYLPDGIHLTTGDTFRVNKYLENQVTHHACIHWYHGGQVYDKTWGIRGKNTRYSLPGRYHVSLEKLNWVTKSDFGIHRHLVKACTRFPSFNKNHKYILSVTDKEQDSQDEQRIAYVKTFRSLPKSYIKELAKFTV